MVRTTKVKLKIEEKYSRKVQRYKNRAYSRLYGIMLTENCAIVGCSIILRHKDISLFKLPAAKANG